MSDHPPVSIIRAPLVGLLAWIVPGLGHLLIGDRVRGWVCLCTVTVVFWSGVAIGGVQGTVAPRSRKLWFVAQLGTGGNALAAFQLHRMVAPQSARSGTPMYAGHWLAAEVGVHYTGVAGLLNVLVILDAIVRADPSYRRRRGDPNGST